MLPEGPFSALAANGNLCKGALAMPTEFMGQNGAFLKQSTKMTVTGCPKAKKAKAKVRPSGRQAQAGQAAEGARARSASKGGSGNG